MIFQCYDSMHRRWWFAQDRNERIYLSYDNQWYYYRVNVMDVAIPLVGEATWALWEARKNKDEKVEIDETYLEETEACATTTGT